jgi:hypothetical protein
VVDVGRDVDAQVGATEHHARADGGGLQREADARPRVQADPRARHLTPKRLLEGDVHNGYRTLLIANGMPDISHPALTT